MSSSDNPQSTASSVRKSDLGCSAEQVQITFLGEIDVIETLSATQVSSNTYCLQSSSAFGDVFYGDVIEVQGEGSAANRFVRVVSRSGMCVKTFILSEELLASDSLKRLVDRVVALGGVSERAYGGVLFVHLPTELDIDLDLEVRSLKA